MPLGAAQVPFVCSRISETQNPMRRNAARVFHVEHEHAPTLATVSPRSCAFARVHAFAYARVRLRPCACERANVAGVEQKAGVFLSF